MTSVTPLQRELLLSASEVVLNDDDACTRFLATHGVGPTVFDHLEIGIRLSFTGDVLTKIEDKSSDERSIQPEERHFFYRTIPEHPDLSFIADPSGANIIGGQPPEELRIPDPGFATQFQYLGCLSRTDPAYSWLPVDLLYLVAPIFLEFRELFVDYTNPLSPTVLSESTFYYDKPTLDPIDRRFEIAFQPVTCRLVPRTSGSTLGRGGFPYWLTSPAIPRCPRSGSIMRFGCQLFSDCTAVQSHSLPADVDSHWLATMHFWCDGELFVFISPESRIACYMIQNN